MFLLFKFIDNSGAEKTKKEIDFPGPHDDENKIPQGKYNLDFLDDINPFETKSKVNTSIGATEKIPKEEDILQKQNLELDLKSISDNIDARDNMVSPVDLPNLEEIRRPASTAINCNKDILQDITIEASKNSKEQKDNIVISEIEKPNSINISQSTSPSVRRKVSTPDFEEEERQLMMEENPLVSSIYPKKKGAILKSEPFKLDLNSPKLGIEDDSRKHIEDQPSVIEPAFSKKETIESLSDPQPMTIHNNPLILSSPSEKYSPSVFSPLPSSNLPQNNSNQNENEMHVHWDEFNTSKDAVIKQVELSNSKKDEFVKTLKTPKDHAP